MNIDKKIFPYLVLLIFSIIEAMFWQIGVINLMGRGIPMANTGTLLGHYLITCGLLSLPTGFFSDKFNRKIILIAGFIFLALGAILIVAKLLIIGVISLAIGFTLFFSCQKTFFSDFLIDNYSYSRLQVLTSFEIIKRIGIAISAFATWRLQSISNNLPWIFWLIFSLIACMLLIPLKSKNRHPKELEIKKSSYLIDNHKIAMLSIFLIGTVFAGIEYGIRNIVFNPFLTQVLSSSDLSSLQIQGLVQSTAGLFGSVFFLYFLNHKKSILSTPVIALLLSATTCLYAYLDYYASENPIFSVFMLYSFVGIFGMGIFLPLRDELVLRCISSKRRNLGLSCILVIQNLTAGLTLYSIQGLEYDLENIKEMWKYASAALVASALLYLAVGLIGYHKTLTKLILTKEISK